MYTQEDLLRIEFPVWNIASLNILNWLPMIQFKSDVFMTYT